MINGKSKYNPFQEKERRCTFFIHQIHKKYNDKITQTEYKSSKTKTINQTSKNRKYHIMSKLRFHSLQLCYRTVTAEAVLKASEEDIVPHSLLPFC